MKMKIVLTILIILTSFTYNVFSLNVDVYRGNIFLFSAETNIDEINSSGLIFSNCEFSDFSNENKNSWEDIFNEVHSTPNSLKLPLTNVSDWNSTKKAHLGALIQTSFTTKNDDSFILTLAFPNCDQDVDFAKIELLPQLLRKKKNEK